MLRRTVDGTIDNLGETHHLSQERIFFFSRAFSIWFNQFFVTLLAARLSWRKSLLIEVNALLLITTHCSFMQMFSMRNGVR